MAQRKKFFPTPSERREEAYSKIEQLPEPKRVVEEPEWDAGFDAELAYTVKVSKRFIGDMEYPTISVSPWLILALARRVKDCGQTPNDNSDKAT